MRIIFCCFKLETFMRYLTKMLVSCKCSANYGFLCKFIKATVKLVLHVTCSSCWVFQWWIQRGSHLQFTTQAGNQSQTCCSGKKQWGIPLVCGHGHKFLCALVKPLYSVINVKCPPSNRNADGIKVGQGRVT